MSKSIIIALNEPLKLEPIYAATSLTSEEHGPFRFSLEGVAFGSAEEPFFVPWAKVSGVKGWEPTQASAGGLGLASGAALAAHVGPPPLEAGNRKFKP